jgi:hypothetical protein
LTPGIITAVVEKDLAFSGDMEFSGAPLVDEQLVGLDSLLLQNCGENGIDLATESHGILVTFNQRELWLVIILFVTTLPSTFRI